MKCSKCQFENPEGSKFCGGCGQNLDLTCPECGANNPAENKFCNECGSDLKPVKEVSDQITETINPPVSPSKETIGTDTPSTTGERKHVTVLFSDLTGYTAMSEKLDPEEVKEITSQIFGDISKIVGKYDGFIEKYAGDAVMAIFGAPKAHEDDPIRAVKVAREIHELVDAISPEIKNRIGQPISMHTGINTGLVVTGEVDMERGTHGVAGDTINLASRLSSLAKPGEILVDVDTCRQVEGHFTCEYLEPTMVKGKADPVQVHKVLFQKEKPITIHRLSGLRADLIGRKMELTELGEAVENLREGKGRIFSICGAAGTGKSRLVEDFKATLNLEEIQWLEGHAYAYSQNIPYFPMIDLLNRVFQIEEDDPPDNVREKVESGIEQLVGKQEDVVPYVGGLYSLSYPEVEEVSPEYWRSRLQEAIQAILSALFKSAPTIFFLEDLHWADPSFVELLRRACLEIRQPAIVLCVYRPTISLFTSHQLGAIGNIYNEIRLQDLSASEAQDMLESLLKTERIPTNLRRLVQSKAEGNPFYLEELVNSLIESETLIRDNGSWKITRPITESDISSSIHGLISGRLDRLEKETKRILQEASVIGRAFFYEILKRVTDIRDQCDQCLSGLERLDLVRTRSLQPDLEYIFKHSLTQEVVYNGLLKKERRILHEKIGLVMEQLFHDRLSEFYETLAFHFKNGQSILKAIDYLRKSGEKSLKRYSVDESNKYYKEAFDLLNRKPARTREEEHLFIDLIFDWANVLYYIGDFKKLEDLLRAHEGLAESLQDKERLGMFYVWLGMCLGFREHFNEAYEYLNKALKLGEETGDQQVIGYACTWLTWICAELGFLDQAILFGKKAYEKADIIKSDQYLYFKSLAGMGYTYWYKGDTKKALEVGKKLLEFGNMHSNIRSIVMGYWMMSFSAYVDGDFLLGIKYSNQAVEAALDPFYAVFPKVTAAFCYALTGQIDEAQEVAQKAVNFCQETGNGWVNRWFSVVLGVVSVFKGDTSQGLKMLEADLSLLLKNGRRPFYAAVGHTLGSIYLQMAQEDSSASKKAEDYFNKVIEVAKEIGANCTLGMAYLDLGLLHKAMGEKDQARRCLSSAIQVFEECEAETRLKHAREALKSLL